MTKEVRETLEHIVKVASGDTGHLSDFGRLMAIERIAKDLLNNADKNGNNKEKR